MAAFNSWVVSDATETSHATSGSWNNKLTKASWTAPNANRAWIVFFYCELKSMGTTTIPRMRVTVDGTSHFAAGIEGRDVTAGREDYRPYAGFIVIDGEATPSAHTINLDFQSSSTTTVYCKNAKFRAFELPTDAKVSSLLTTRQTYTGSSSAWGDVSGTTTPALNAEDYIVLVSAAIDCENAGSMTRPQLEDSSGGTLYATPPFIRPQDTADRIAWFAAWLRRTGDASGQVSASATINMSHAPNSSTSTVGANYVRIVALPTAAFRNVYAFERTTAETSASTTSYADTGVAYSPTIANTGDHFVAFATSTEFLNTSNAAYLKAVFDGTDLGEHVWESASTTSDRAMQASGALDIVNIASTGSKTAKWQRKTNTGTVSVQIEPMASIVILDLEEAGGGTVTGTGASTLAITGSGSGEAYDTHRLNPADNASEITFSNAFLTATKTSGGAAYKTVRGLSSKTTGAYYFEAENVGLDNVIAGIGRSDVDTSQLLGFHGVRGIGAQAAGNIVQGVVVATTATWKSSGAKIYVAADFIRQLVWFKPSTDTQWNASGTADPATGVGGISFSAAGAGPFYPAVSVYSSAVPDAITLNLGGSAFSGTAPAGFLPWTNELAWVVGTGAATLGITGSGSGTAASPVTGTGAATLSITGSGAGARGAAGTGAATLTITGSAAGARGAAGTASATLAITGSGSGTHAAYVGTGAATLAITGAGTGVHGVAGTAAATLAITGSASGVRGAAGTASATLAITGSGAGTATGATVSGTGAATLSITGSGTGASGAAGTGSATLAITASAAGNHGVAGSASATLDVTGSALGSVVIATVTGTGSAELIIVGEALGDWLGWITTPPTAETWTGQSGASETWAPIPPSYPEVTQDGETVTYLGEAVTYGGASAWTGPSSTPETWTPQSPTTETWMAA